MRRTLVAFSVLPWTIASAAEWQTLFNGYDLHAWKCYRKPEGTQILWAIDAGTIAWRKGAGDLMTREKFRDFELELEWKISPGGNSGVMFGVDESSDKAYHTGPEIQILDEAGQKSGKTVHLTGAIYSLYPPLTHPAKPVGEWNALRVRVQRNQVQTWLNGELTAEATIGSEDWNARVAKSKFAAFAKFAKIQNGSIVLQDHSSPVWYRKIRIRSL